MLTYWTSCFFFYLLDLKYLEPSHNNWKKYIKAIKMSLFNQFMIDLPVLYLLRNMIKNSISNTDSNIIHIFKVIIIVNLANLIFYTFHRIFHINQIYKYIHYKHHEFIEPIAVATFYAHPIEHLLSNVLSFIVPIILIGTTYNTMIILLCLATFVSTVAHAKYNILPVPNDHLIHHKYLNITLGLEDI
jgi:methylsterol monooxygenase